MLRFDVVGGKMFRTVDFKDINEKHILIDVRSPGEFKEATIPGAVNLPLFDDEERKNIGTVYVNESTEKAKKLGVEAVSRKLPALYEELAALDKEYDKLILFCARGGMRSTSICSLLGTLGVSAYKLGGGYKGYRSFINEELPKVNEQVKYIVLRGKTGTGKTELLKCLKDKGMDVLDLEEAANHRGSLLGSVGLGKVRSQKQFESIIYEELKNRKTNYVFVEGESRKIGNIIIPEYIFNSMVNGIHVLIEADLDFRAKLILDEYLKTNNAVEDILKSLELLGKHISKENIERYRDLVNKGEYEEVAKELMVKYYDPMYMNGISKYEYDLKHEVRNIEASCEFLKQWVEEYIQKNV
jgi:tRNA 2-selenouridine synthase